MELLLLLFAAALTLAGGVLGNCTPAIRADCTKYNNLCRSPVQCCSGAGLVYACSGKLCCTSCSTCDPTYNDGTYAYGTPTCNAAPATCGTRCGMVADGCGGGDKMSCGGCGPDATCVSNNCVCDPISCPANNCGNVSSSCTSADCGLCGADESCLANNTCSCDAVSCLAENCGILSNACGQNADCGACNLDENCISNTCVCPKPVCSTQQSCGTVTNACSQNSDCGACNLDENCISNTCVCPKPVCSTQQACGTVTNACGETSLFCGMCDRLLEVCSASNNTCILMPVGPNVTVGIPTQYCNVSVFNETAFAQELAVAYIPMLLIETNVVVLAVRCIGSVLEVTFAIRGTTTGGTNAMPLPPGIGNGTTWSIIDWPGYTTTTTTTSGRRSIDRPETVHETADDSSLASVFVGIAAGMACLAILFAIGSTYLRRRFKIEEEVSMDRLDLDLPLEERSARHYDSISLIRPSYTAERVIGSGQFGQVYYGRSSRNQVCAMKELNIEGMSASALDEMKREAALLEKCQHEFVVQFFGVVERSEIIQGSDCPALSDGVFMVMALCAFGDLKSAILNRAGGGIGYDSLSIMVMAEQAARGMAFLHTQNVVHRDIALRNFLVSGCDRENSLLTMDDGSPCRVLISDFGLGRMLGSDYAAYYSQNEGQLPVRWIAPEAMLKGRYGKESDVYAFGVSICELVTGGQLPFMSYSTQDLVDSVVSEACAMNAPPSFVVAEKPNPFILPGSGRAISPEMWQLALACCATDPGKRPTFQSIAEHLAALQSSWDEKSMDPCPV